MGSFIGGKTNKGSDSMESFWKNSFPEVFGTTLTMQQQFYSTPDSLVRAFALAVPLWMVRSWGTEGHATSGEEGRHGDRAGSIMSAARSRWTSDSMNLASSGVYFLEREAIGVHSGRRNSNKRGGSSLAAATDSFWGFKGGIVRAASGPFITKVTDECSLRNSWPTITSEQRFLITFWRRRNFRKRPIPPRYKPESYLIGRQPQQVKTRGSASKIRFFDRWDRNDSLSRCWFISWVRLNTCARAYARGEFGVKPPPWAWHFTKTWLPAQRRLFSHTFCLLICRLIANTIE